KLKLKAGQTVRGMVNLPHGAGKEPKVAIFNENMLSEIQKSKLDFDILVAKPQDMPLLIKVAKILGPKGKMPTPKAGTVTENPEELIKKIKSGQVEYKADAQGIVHQIIGKASWEKQKLIENYNALLEVLKQYNPISIAICTTMGPSVKIEVM
ncbi:MAG: 50S ribosomal protein L1, partial [Candidatus Berkelbacteria bacterium]|nr:50S ribosomal protein L1 [Candidatus Berkelbacteria bacterium]